jgi:DUF2934 family protein
MAKRAADRPPARPRAKRPAQAPESNGSNGGLNVAHQEPAPNEDDVRVRAYHRYLERGAGHGSDFDDWVEAEKDLKVAHN